MRKNLMKARLQEGRPIIGFTLLAYWPDAIDILGLLGVDYVMIDGEHGAVGRPEVAGLVRACESAGITPVVRVSSNSPDQILGYLDAGAQAIVIPNVSSKEDAERAVTACKYWPVGRRGCGYGHALDWLIRQPFSEYIKDANEEVMVCPMIESKEGLENVEEIVNVPGVDSIWPGPADLAQSLGVAGQMNHPVLLDALERIKRVTVAAGKYICGGATDGDAARNAFQEGYHIVNYGVHRFLIAGVRDYVTKARAG